MHHKASLRIGIICVSNRHTPETDVTGDWLAQQIPQQGHQLHEQRIVAEDCYQLRALVSHWIAEPSVQVILVHGGTGFQAKNCTTEALKPLMDRTIDGFGELFRSLSYHAVEATPVLSAAMQSDAFAGLANHTLVFAIPGSPSAAQLAAEALIWPQLDSDTRPCNFASLLQKHSCSPDGCR